MKGHEGLSFVWCVVCVVQYGYRTTPEIMEALQKNQELKESLSAVAHLIHGSSEGRFRVTYCTSAHGLTREEVEGVGYNYMPYEEAVSLDSVPPCDFQIGGG
jgi:hypothetical protein